MLQPLDIHFNVAVLRMAEILFPCGYDVGGDAPSSFDGLKDHVRRTGRMLVWNGASDRTIFGGPECDEVNFAFRAWHDWSHLKEDAPFTREGETRAAGRQIADLKRVYGDCDQTRRWSAIIMAEVDGEGEYFRKFGAFPEDQRGFVEMYLADPAAALSEPRFGLSS